MTADSSKDYKLSLTTAILININIMLGAGIFINTSALAQRAGFLGGFMYMVVGILMLPLILSIAQLLRLHPAGGFYTFASKEVSPFMGFLSCWCYFTSKLASSMLMIHVSVTLLQTIFPALAATPAFLLDFLIVTTFIGLNMLNIKAGSVIQKMFIGFKTFPILFAILTGVFLLQDDNFSSSKMVWEGMQTSLPLVIYAIVGFEAACSMSGKIKDAQKNAPKAVLISFGIVIAIATLYQSIFFGSLGDKLLSCGGHCDIFPTLVESFFGGGFLASKFEGILHLAIASSTFGAAYGIIFSNSWNLHILAENRHIPFAALFLKMNKNLIPYACVLVEGVLCLTYLFVSQGVLIPLQQIGALGCVMAYTFSVAALYRASKYNPQATFSKWIPIAGLASCLILLAACVRSFFINGMSSLVVYAFLLVVGVGFYWITSRKPTPMLVSGSDR